MEASSSFVLPVLQPKAPLPTFLCVQFPHEHENMTTQFLHFFYPYIFPILGSKGAFKGSIMGSARPAHAGAHSHSGPTTRGFGLL